MKRIVLKRSDGLPEMQVQVVSEFDRITARTYWLRHHQSRGFIF